MCILGAEKQEEVRMERFCGSVKSFNTRRGFGFLSCKETAQRFGRDVYLSKEEAMLLAGEPAIALASRASTATTDKETIKVPSPVQEGDILMFQVKLSTEGFPQAVQPQKIRRLRGVVRHAPSSAGEGIIVVTGDDSENTDVSSKRLVGAEVRLCQAECGQLLLQPNDVVAFCCVDVADGQSMGAQLIDLLHTSRADGSVLGCFSLSLPQLSNIEVGTPNMELHGHALTDCIVLSEVPEGLSMPDLTRLFSKLGLGGAEATVTPARGIMFDEPESIAKFLTQATHTISENGTTQLAHVAPCPYRKHGGHCCCCTPKTSIGSRSVETTPVTQPFPQPIYNLCVANAVEMHVPDANLALPAPLLSTPPMEPTPLNFGSFPVHNLEQHEINFGCFSAQSLEISMTRTSTSPSWRCMHNSIVLPSAAPEMFATGTNGCSVCIQWPTVIHASSYVVEFVDQVGMIGQRFTHVSPEGMLPALMNMHIDGLQSNAYAACVRCVAPCGCESTSSPWSSVSGAVPSASAVQMLVPNVPFYALAAAPVVASHSCPPPPLAPPTLSLAATSTQIPLPPILEEGAASINICPEDVLTLD